MGLNDSGKTTLAKELAKQLKAVHWESDEVRANLNKDLDFSIESRIEQARRMRFLAETVNKAGYIAIMDFIAPLEEARQELGEDTFIVWMNTVKPSENRYEDTGKIFVSPSFYDMVFTEWKNPVDMATEVIKELNYTFIEDRKNYQI